MSVYGETRDATESLCYCPIGTSNFFLQPFEVCQWASTGCIYTIGPGSMCPGLLRPSLCFESFQLFPAVFEEQGGLKRSDHSFISRSILFTVESFISEYLRFDGKLHIK